MIERVRRVVIGAQRGQESTFTHVEEVAPFESGGAPVTQWPVWGWDELPAVPHADAGPYEPGAPFPAPGGVRVITLRGHGDTAAFFKEAGRTLPGLFHDDARPGMHSTDTVDVGIVIEGEATVEAGDGTKVKLRPGDVYVCNGALHRWHYDSAKPASIVFIVFGAELAGTADTYARSIR
jgi:mannose-6-phosphate isomerase-like protein (cupin superfamily)